MPLSTSETRLVRSRLNRSPNPLELAVFTAMWSEHCSYKSSIAHLKQFKSSSYRVVQGPGENAGAVDCGGGYAAVFKMESHNHPSFLDPIQGAATGVGGVLRDVFVMGAQPVALLNALRFAPPNHPLTPRLLNGVAAGIASYGNCVGVPTIGGSTAFHHNYSHNILVNAMCVGFVPVHQMRRAQSTSKNALLVYAGAPTGPDGVHGADMASQSFQQQSSTPRNAVQIGDPFSGNLLMDATLLAMKTPNLIIGAQDMGAAGLTSSSVEIAAKSKLGAEINLQLIPLRSPLSPVDVMISETQERALFLVAPERAEELILLLKQQSVPAAVIGRLNSSRRLTLKLHDETIADIPLNALKPPVLRRPSKKPPAAPKIAPPKTSPPKTFPAPAPLDALVHLLSSYHLASRRPIHQQYDATVQGRTLSRQGDPGASVILAPNQRSAVAVSVGCNTRYCSLNPRLGALQAVAQTFRELSAAGAQPLGLTDCLNFGNPENPHVMHQFIEVARAIADASNILNLPVVSGNVSFYNAHDNHNIPPTPMIGSLGVIPEASSHSIPALQPNLILLLLGPPPHHDDMPPSLLNLLFPSSPPPVTPPNVNLQTEKHVGSLVARLLRRQLLSCARSINDGGALAAASSLALAGQTGCSLHTPSKINPNLFWFAETQARYLVALKPQNLQHVLLEAAMFDVHAQHIGESSAQNDPMRLDSQNIPLNDLFLAQRDALDLRSPRP